MLVFSSGLMTFSSRSNCASAALDFSILRLQLFELALHEVAQAGGRLVADAIGVGQIGQRDFVGDIGGQLAVGGAIADLQNIGIRRARDLADASESPGASQAGGATCRWLLRARPSPRRADGYLSTTGRSTESDSISLTCVARNWSASLVAFCSGFLAEDAGGHLAVDIDRDGRFVDRRQAQRNDQGRQHHGRLRSRRSSSRGGGESTNSAPAERARLAARTPRRASEGRGWRRQRAILPGSPEMVVRNCVHVFNARSERRTRSTRRTW